MKTILCHISISEMMAVHLNKAGTHATCFGITYSSILIVLFSSGGIVGHVSTETAWLGMVCFPFRGFSTVKSGMKCPKCLYCITLVKMLKKK